MDGNQAVLRVGNLKGLVSVLHSIKPAHNKQVTTTDRC